MRLVASSHAVSVASGARPRRGERALKLYEKLADDIEALVTQGVYRPGEKIPSVRRTSQHHRLSITTVLRAYALLESRGVIESRPQSGYIVRPQGPAVAAELAPSKPLAISASVDVSRLVLSTLRSIRISPYSDSAW